MAIKDGGWQVNVEYEGDYVIKTLKTPKEIKKKIAKHFERSGELKKLDNKIKALLSDWQEAVSIVKSGVVPLDLLANPEFLGDNKVKQQKVVMLSEVFQDLVSKGEMSKAKKLVDKVIDFIITLWTFGVHEKTFKFYTEMGLLNDNIVLVDFGELTDKKEKVIKQITKDNKKLEKLRKYHHDKILDYYQEQIRKRLTVDTLEKNWGKALS